MQYSEKFKSTLAQLIYQELHNQLKIKQLKDYQILVSGCQDWTDRHFERAAELVQVSNSTLKRLFRPQNYDHSGFNARTQVAFCQFLGFADWQTLEQTVWESIFVGKQNFSNFD
ncbi:MAG: hypothetical protein MUE85_19165 [Microscillaceae bacterium]|jgi:hypothetical protein|nr:hypothetical protein [Microscillaceae bacterium]